MCSPRDGTTKLTQRMDAQKVRKYCDVAVALDHAGLEDKLWQPIGYRSALRSFPAGMECDGC
jgi:hypothetical protein